MGCYWSTIRMLTVKFIVFAFPETHFTSQLSDYKERRSEAYGEQDFYRYWTQRLFTALRSVSNFLFGFSLSRITRSEQFYLKPFQVIGRTASRYIKGCFHTGCIRRANIFQKSRNNFKILRARTAMWNKFLSEDP